MTLTQVNTPFVEAVNQGINHSEGGWPKDVSATDPEQTTRYRRKLEKDEQFAVQIMSVAGVRTTAASFTTCFLTELRLRAIDIIPNNACRVEQL